MRKILVAASMILGLLFAFSGAHAETIDTERHLYALDRAEQCRCAVKIESGDTVWWYATNKNDPTPNTRREKTNPGGPLAEKSTTLEDELTHLSNLGISREEMINTISNTLRRKLNEMHHDGTYQYGETELPFSELVRLIPYK